MNSEGKKNLFCITVVLVIVLFIVNEIIKSAEETYTVLPGDSWCGIAEQFNISPEDLAEYNGRSIDDQLFTDQKLKIPKSNNSVSANFADEEKLQETDDAEKNDSVNVPEPELEPEKMTHIVSKGDTLYSIAKKYNVDINELIFINKIEDPNVIYLGSELIIKINDRKELLPFEPEETNTTITEIEEKTKLINSVVELTTDTTELNSLYNIELACKNLDGFVLYPGETFSWFEVIGPADESQGYKIATVIADGKTSYAAGGGICLVSTALMQAARTSGCEIIERHDHGLPISYAKPGDEATVSYGWLDLKFKNNSAEQAIIFKCSSNGQTCKVETFS
ncbi:MAG: LysM peptidoglycan-binding domain-containing protein [Clostridiales bacterium]|nr:LysM peptidoglycan-binding domain-containing protein [Clostridiales bacterium]